MITFYNRIVRVLRGAMFYVVPVDLLDRKDSAMVLKE